ncbi:prenyltransferase/squalene oxidase repeat-containing protein [Bdellovibrio bacteriovorus]|uniref:prenyltransferase/squalene oxidase repeat-containing protein n=1 Tax=Bdellovibrio bacteriovorus TaxID=959 RepID=UPI003AA82E43
MKYLLFLLGLISATAQARYEKHIDSALDFLAHYQTTGREGYEPGQWRSRVTSYVPSGIGVGKFGVAYDEPSAFSASAIANVLAETYFYNPRFSKIPPMVRKTAQGLGPYRWGDLFNFYPPSSFKGVRTRGPRNMYLAPQWKGFANIPPDADTTSVTHTYLHFLKSLEAGQSPRKMPAQLPEAVIDAFSSARDLSRLPHTYNAAQLHVNTGAFMTWLWDEKDPDMPRNIFAAPHRGTRIPFNVNDVDCVVNANVLKLLTYAKKTEGPGYQASCRHLNRVVSKRQFYFCGMYYPSRYALPYAMAATINAGASCLEPSRQKLLNYILALQHKDGSWRNSFMARPDYAHSTAWALNTLLILGDPQNEMHRERVRRGLNFLMSQSQKDFAGRLFWSGQVFFAATFVARFPVVWRSTGYTTALAVKALTLADLRWN